MNRQSKIWTRLSALCLALLLAVGMLGTTAFAANDIVANTGSITVENVEGGVTVSAYKVLDVIFDYEGQQPVVPVYQWASNVQNWVKTNYSAYIGTDNSVTEAFSTATADQVAEFYDKLAAAIKGGTVTLTATGTRTGSGTIENLPMGGYLILIENGMKVYRPSAVNIVPKYDETASAWKMTTPTVEIKSSEPSIDKTVNEAATSTGAIGDTVNYDIRADIPQYPANAIETKYAIRDTLPTGLTLVTDSIQVYGVSAGGTETLLAEGTHYTRTADETGFTLSFTYAQIKSYAKIHVDYNATINSSVVIGPDGNENHAVLEYTNNPYVANSYKTKVDKVKVYSYGIKVTKVDGTGTVLTGAEFTLSKSADGSDALYFIKTGDGAYRLAASASESGATQTLVVGVGDKGKLTLSGLDLGTYYLTETRAPDGGYNKLNQAVTIEIKDDDLDGEPTNKDSSEYGDGYVAVDVTNTKGFQLPTTGGMGTVLFTAGGIAIMGAAVLLFFVLKRKAAKQ